MDLLLSKFSRMVLEYNSKIYKFIKKIKKVILLILHLLKLVIIIEINKFLKEIYNRQHKLIKLLIVFKDQK